MAISIVLLCLMMIGGSLCRRSEKRNWNNGVCVISGQPWVLFDTDSQGGRGYKDGQGNFCWISYRVDTIRN